MTQLLIQVCTISFTEIKAGQAVHDVACMDFVWLAAFVDAIEPITGADTSDFLPTLEESGTIDGNLLGYPMGEFKDPYLQKRSDSGG